MLLKKILESYFYKHIINEQGTSKAVHPNGVVEDAPKKDNPKTNSKKAKANV